MSRVHIFQCVFSFGKRWPMSLSTSCAGAPPLFSPFDLVSFNMPKLRGTTSDSDDDYDKGCGMSSAHSLASNTSPRGRRKPRKGAGTVSPAGSNARAARAAARAKNITSTSNAQSPPHAVPTEVVTRLYKHGKLIRTVPAKSNPSKAACDGLIYSDDDEEDLNAVDDDEYIEKNFTSFPKPAAVSRNRVMST